MSISGILIIHTYVIYSSSVYLVKKNKSEMIDLMLIQMAHAEW